LTKFPGFRPDTISPRHLQTFLPDAGKTIGGSPVIDSFFAISLKSFDFIYKHVLNIFNILCYLALK